MTHTIYSPGPMFELMQEVAASRHWCKLETQLLVEEPIELTDDSRAVLRIIDRSNGNIAEVDMEHFLMQAADYGFEASIMVTHWWTWLATEWNLF